VVQPQRRSQSLELVIERRKTLVADHSSLVTTRSIRNNTNNNSEEEPIETNLLWCYELLVRRGYGVWNPVVRNGRMFYEITWKKADVVKQKVYT
jgi:hypothetical protein